MPRGSCAEMKASAATDFPDEQTNPDARAPLHPSVIAWLQMRIEASRRYAEDADVLAGFEALLALAKGGTR